MDYYTNAFTNYTNFKGRSSRKAYWMFVLVNVIISIILSVVDAQLNGPDIISGIYSLAVIVPSLAILVRRLHDVNKSGYWAFIMLIPIIGAIVLIVLAIKKGDIGSNQYGPEPKDLAENTPASQASTPENTPASSTEAEVVETPSQTNETGENK